MSDFNSTEEMRSYMLPSIEQAQRIKRLEQENFIMKTKLEYLEQGLKNPSSIKTGPNGIFFSYTNSTLEDFFLKEMSYMVISHLEDEDILDAHDIEAYDVYELLTNAGFYLRNRPEEERQMYIDKYNTFSKAVESYLANQSHFYFSDSLEEQMNEELQDYADDRLRYVLAQNPNLVRDMSSIFIEIQRNDTEFTEIVERYDRNYPQDQ